MFYIRCVLHSCERKRIELRLLPGKTSLWRIKGILFCLCSGGHSPKIRCCSGATLDPVLRGHIWLYSRDYLEGVLGFRPALGHMLGKCGNLCSISPAPKAFFCFSVVLNPNTYVLSSVIPKTIHWKKIKQVGNNLAFLLFLPGPVQMSGFSLEMGRWWEVLSTYFPSEHKGSHFVRLRGRATYRNNWDSHSDQQTWCFQSETCNWVMLFC